MARRSDIAKLVSKAREVWRQSENYQAVKKRAKAVDRPGWFVCERGKELVEVIKIDHIEPIGKQPTDMGEFGLWLPRLFCPISNLQGLCNTCHKSKTKIENAERKKYGRKYVS